MPFARVIEEMLAFRGEIADPQAGVRLYVTALEIESPVELDVTRQPGGALVLGSTPPLYGLRTSVAPSYHRLRFTASLETDDGIA